MLYHTIVITLLVLIVAALASGLFYLVKDKGESNRVVKALSLRVALSFALFALLMVAGYLQIIVPHGL